MDYSQVEIPDWPHELGLVYIAGPMSGINNWNYPAFEEMATKLRARGDKVISPHELHEPDSSVAWDWYLRRDLTQLVKCHEAVMLPGWGRSRGAQLEHHVAKSLGMRISYPGDPRWVTK